jgi:PAS domain S-box-containing protein
VDTIFQKRCEVHHAPKENHPMTDAQNGINSHLTLRDLQKKIEEQSARLEREIAERARIASQRDETLEALRESEEKYRALVENSPNGIFISDMERFIYVNQRLSEITGFSRDELLNMPDPTGTLLAPQERKRLLAYAQSRLRGDPTPKSYLVRGVRKDGNEVPLEFTMSSIVLSGQRVLQGTVEDITERVQAEEERAALIARLEAQNAELERFTYTISHDLKSPLITIQGFLGLLLQDVASGNVEQMRRDATFISDAVQKMEQLLNELLALSRIGRVVNPPRETPVGELVREALDMVAGQLQGQGVRVEIAPELLKAHGGPTVYGDRARLREVWQNLVDNAVKYMGDQPEPRVEIGMRCDGDEKVFYVRDNGIGIDPRHHDKVFGLFNKLDPQTEGTGVGLAIVKRIVEVHGGCVWVESEGAGQGSTFCFTLVGKQG